MLSQSVITAILAFTASALAMPQPTMAPRQLEGTEDIIDPATYASAIGGAIDIANHYATATAAYEVPEATAAPDLAEREDDKAILARAPPALTIRVINQFGKPISTVHARNAGAPAAISGNVGPGVLAHGATGSFAVPTGWAGNVAIVENGGGRAIVGDESLIEGSFVRQGGTDAIIDIDISYVVGFSVPVVCSCEGRTVTGCNKNLWGLGTCGNDNRAGSCRNPNRGNDGATSPTPFFAPCRGGAYTFPRDHGANANGWCTSGIVNCCVGTSCPRNPNQPA